MINYQATSYKCDRMVIFIVKKCHVELKKTYDVIASLHIALQFVRFVGVKADNLRTIE